MSSLAVKNAKVGLVGFNCRSTKEYRYRLQAYLEVDQVGALIAEAKGWMSQSVGESKETLKEIGYFENNQSRMLYGTFRANGYFIGSGVIEAGCKTVIGQRVKQSGILWSLSGADHVLAVRCALMNGDFESYWRQQGFFPVEMKKAAWSKNRAMSWLLFCPAPQTNRQTTDETPDARS